MEQDLRFPKAFSGVKKIFIGQILALISSGLIVIGVVVYSLYPGIGALDKVLALLALYCLIAALIVLAVGAVFRLIGIIQARRDEASFTAALIWTIIGEALGLAALFVTYSSIFQIASVCAGLVSLYYIVRGIGRLSTKLGRFSFVRCGKTAFGLIIAGYCTYAAAFFVSLLLWFIALLPALVALTLLIVGYVRYLMFLSRAKKLLGGGEVGILCEDTPREAPGSFEPGHALDPFQRPII